MPTGLTPDSSQRLGRSSTCTIISCPIRHSPVVGKRCGRAGGCPSFASNEDGEREISAAFGEPSRARSNWLFERVEQQRGSSNMGESHVMPESFEGLRAKATKCRDLASTAVTSEARDVLS